MGLDRRGSTTDSWCKRHSLVGDAIRTQRIIHQYPDHSIDTHSYTLSVRIPSPTRTRLASVLHSARVAPGTIRIVSQMRIAGIDVGRAGGRTGRRKGEHAEQPDGVGGSRKCVPGGP